MQIVSRRKGLMEMRSIKGRRREGRINIEKLSRASSQSFNNKLRTSEVRTLICSQVRKVLNRDKYIERKMCDD